MEYYLQALKKYADFEGRARRKEYWMFVLFNMIFAVTFFAIDMMLFGVADGEGVPVLYPIYILAIILPSIAVVVRRLHDLGKSGWMYFIVFIPIIGGIWMFVLMVTEGEWRANEYGPNPKEGEVNIA